MNENLITPVKQSERNSLVLVADDDPTMRLLISETLGGAGFRVDTVENGAEALAICEQREPDIILLDVMMPIMDGFAACRALRNREASRNTQIVMLTGLDDVESISNAYEVGATDFMTKPINYQILSQRIHYMLRVKCTSDALRESERRLRNAQRIARLGHWEWDCDQNIFDWSDEMYQILGLNPKSDEPTLDNLLAKIQFDHRTGVEIALRNAKQRGETGRIEYPLMLSDEEDRFVLQEMEVIRNGDGHVVKVLGIIQDISDIRQAEQTIHKLSFVDDLTGLPNSRYFRKHLEQQINHAARHRRIFSLLSIEIDQFERIKEVFGNEGTNIVLKSVADRLSDCVRGNDSITYSGIETPGYNNDILIRLSGDRFLIFLSEVKDAKDASLVARRIVTHLSEPVLIEGKNIPITISIGIILSPENRENCTTLLDNADIAIQQAKDEGRNNFTFFSAERNQQECARLELETDLHNAIVNNELLLYYQPKVNVRSGRTTGVEALLRWKHPTRGFAQADNGSQFITHTV